MHRVVVVGSSGSGKTAVAGELAHRLGVVHIEMDALNHGPGWTEATPEELRQVVAGAIDGRDGWIVDGNYEGKLGDIVLRQADTVVWLDLPLTTCLRRLWGRTLHRVRDGVELWNGNRETWRGAIWGRDALFWWTIRHHRRRRRVWPQRFSSLPNVTVVRLRTPVEVERFLANQVASRHRGGSGLEAV